MTTTPIQVAIADDHNMIRKAWILFLSELEHVTVVGEAADGRELIQLLDHTPADVVLLDIDMPRMNGLEATEIIRGRFPRVKIIALTVQKELTFLKRFLALGAAGYVTKNASKEELLVAIQAVAEGRRYVCEELRKALLDKMNGALDKNRSSLSRREMEIVRLIADGFTSREIAQRLLLSLKTVEAHRGNVFRKYKVKNVAEMIKKAREQGLV
ncbi:MAG: response regulator transcription factor [Ferruginibacter sp.]|nr:response regulator transcription factor [Cytophagales bacterium]